jgi:ankyrin repeat protein
MYAAEKKNSTVTRLLCKQSGINIKQQDLLGNTALMYCLKDVSRANYIQTLLTIAILLDAGANPECINFAGQTPLAIAKSLNGAQELIDLIQDGINKKHGKK